MTAEQVALVALFARASHNALVTTVLSASLRSRAGSRSPVAATSSRRIAADSLVKQPAVAKASFRAGAVRRI